MAKVVHRTLAEYLKATGTTQLALAKQLGISPIQVSYLVRRVIEPKVGLALRVHEATGVPLEAMVPERAA